MNRDTPEIEIASLSVLCQNETHSFILAVL